ncbi:hypothetical protein CEK62_14200 [Alcanivorax sp. N3-2A]|nr:hypothetical protein CEK62_14200 [Alcanivorax sp. N3-2A]|tara:strand:- start:51193 stop:52638 length:1446 start_codon:yes stop_codon:yes gene_type:complete
MEKAWTLPPPSPTNGLTRLSVASARPRRLQSWLPLLRPRPLPESAEVLARLLDELARLRIDHRRRYQLLELCRPHAGVLIERLQSQCLNLPLGSPESGLQAAALAHRLGEHLARGYQQVAGSLLRRQQTAGTALASALQRACDALAQRLYLHFLLATAPEPELWARLHRLYAVAEQAAVEKVVVGDDSTPGGNASTHRVYARLLLLASAQPNQLSPPSLLALRRASAHWVTWPELSAQPGDALFLIDLDRDAPPRPVSAGPAGCRRYFDTRPLATALGEDRAGQGGLLSEPLLQHLRWAWFGPRQRQFARRPDTGELLLCLGLSSVHDQLGRHTDEDGPHRARCIDSGAGGHCLQWLGRVPETLRTGGLLALRDPRGGGWRAAQIRWVRRAPPRVRFGVELLPESTRAVRVSHHGEAAPEPALLLPAPTAIDSATLLVDGARYRSGACVTLWDQTPRHACLGLRLAGSSEVGHYTLRETAG